MGFPDAETAPFPPYTGGLPVFQIVKTGWLWPGTVKARKGFGPSALCFWVFNILRGGASNRPAPER